MTEINMLEAIRQAMDEELAADENVIILGSDVGLSGGVFRTTEGLQEKYGSERVIDSPLSGAAVVGVGIGAAVYGLRPICEIQFADFIHQTINMNCFRRPIVNQEFNVVREYVHINFLPEDYR